MTESTAAGLGGLAALVRARFGKVPAWLETDAESGAEPWSVGPREPWYDLGPGHERRVDADERARRGAHYTPRWLAESIVTRAITSSGQRVVDPAAGGGVFLLAAAERLVALGAAPDDALEQLAGVETDPVALTVARTALWWWASARGVTNAPDLRRGDALLDQLPRVDVVIGNPPFLGQLDARTARGRARTDVLTSRFGAAVSAYTDDASLFLLAGLDAVTEGGAVALVQPRSVVAARDSEGVRRRIAAGARLEAIWFDDRPVFGADVRVCVPFIERRRGRGPVAILGSRRFEPVGHVTTRSWSRLAAVAGGVPRVAPAASGSLGDRAAVLAGFRDQYYGLVDGVREAAPDEVPELRLVTTGAIDLAHLRWGEAPIRFAKRSWTRPVVDLAKVDAAGQRWVSEQHRPKILVATQTPTVELVVDAAGRSIGSVPVIAVAPDDPADLWLLAAALASPAVTAHLLTVAAGTARSVDALKPTASLLRGVPLPRDEAAWIEGACALRTAHAATGPDERGRALVRFGRAMARAHGVGEDVNDWWSARLRVR